MRMVAIAAELVGIGLVLAGLALVAIPLALVTAGLALVAAANLHSEVPPNRLVGGERRTSETTDITARRRSGVNAN